MINRETPKFDLNDISIVPAVFSTIDHRNEIDVQTNNFYRLFVAPMDTVVSGFGKNNNTHIFHNKKMRVCVPKLISYTTEQLNSSSFSNFISMSLQQFQKYILDENHLDKKSAHYVLIDIANGHMKSLYNAAILGKKKYPKLVLMVGNIANPRTFEEYYGKVDYIRVGIGNGFACSTSINTGINYPMGSLIEECKMIKKRLSTVPENYPIHTQIVADGGFRSYSDIIKAYALGADYVMIGGIIAKSDVPSPIGKFIDEIDETVSPKNVMKEIADGNKVFKEYRGMSTIEVQKSSGRNKNELRASEGFVHKVEVKYTLEQWMSDYESYLRSSMSYMGFRTISELIDQGHGRLIYITPNSSERFNIKK